MSIVYITNIKYRHFINKVENIKIELLSEPIYTEEGNLLFEVYGANNPKEIFNSILKQFPHLTIQDEYARMDWPECND